MKSWWRAGDELMKSWWRANEEPMKSGWAGLLRTASDCHSQSYLRIYTIYYIYVSLNGTTPRALLAVLKTSLTRCTERPFRCLYYEEGYCLWFTPIWGRILKNHFMSSTFSRPPTPSSSITLLRCSALQIASHHIALPTLHHHPLKISIWQNVPSEGKVLSLTN